MDDLADLGLKPHDLVAVVGVNRLSVGVAHVVDAVVATGEVAVQIVAGFG